MNRRELLTRAMAAAATVTVARTPNVTAAPDVEPVPTQWDFEEAMSLMADATVTTVSHALDKLGWESGLAPRPLLCVHPSAYAYGLEVAAHFAGLVQVWATREVGRLPDGREDVDTWCVAWRGRRVGSAGA